MGSSFYLPLPAALGTFGIIWQETRKGPKVCSVLLPDDRSSVENAVQMAFAGSIRRTCPAISELGERIGSFLAGEAVDFELDVVALEKCSAFQKKVLLAVYKIPRGSVSTYGRIAGGSGVSGGARAVGGALSRNPFPIIIPCHRVIRSNGELGGFGGGIRMKKALLELEGIQFSRLVMVPNSRVR